MAEKNQRYYDQEFQKLVKPIENELVDRNKALIGSISLEASTTRGEKASVGSLKAEFSKNLIASGFTFADRILALKLNGNANDDKMYKDWALTIGMRGLGAENYGPYIHCVNTIYALNTAFRGITGSKEGEVNIVGHALVHHFEPVSGEEALKRPYTGEFAALLDGLGIDIDNPKFNDSLYVNTEQSGSYASQIALKSNLSPLVIDVPTKKRGANNFVACAFDTVLVDTIQIDRDDTARRTLRAGLVFSHKIEPAS